MTTSRDFGEVVTTVRENGALPWERDEKGRVEKKSASFRGDQKKKDIETDLEIDLHRNLIPLTSPDDLLPISTTKNELGLREGMDDLSNVLQLPLLVKIDSERVVEIGERLPLVEVGSFNFFRES